MGDAAASQLPVRAAALALGMQAFVAGAALAAPGEPASPNDRGGAPGAGFAALAADTALVPSPGVERARLSAALGEELGSSLRRLPGVQDARVHLLATPSDQGALGAPATPAKASVLLVLEAGAGHVDEAGVRALVAGAAPAVAPDAVTVVVSREPTAAVGPSAAARPTRERGPGRLLRWVLLALVGSQLLLAGLTIALLRRVRAVEALTRR